MSVKKRPFIIDCDTGTDDAIAIIAALFCPEVEVKALTSVNGNVPMVWTAQNNLNLIEHLGFGVPVAKGAANPFVSLGSYYSDTHGKTGFGNIMLPDAVRSDFLKEDAASCIYKQAVAEGGELELLVIGPMTNIAVALLNYPALKKLVRHIWFMGGAAKGGNVSPTAEFNIWVDPVAARVVCESGIPLTMVGLDVTLQAVLNKEDMNEIRQIGTKAALLAADILEFMTVRCSNGGEDLVMHDALALCAAVSPQCLGMKTCFIDVECHGTYTRGHTMVDQRGSCGKPPNARVALELDLIGFKKWLKSCIRNSKNGLGN